MRMRSSTVTVTPMRPSSSIVVVTSCRCGTLPIVTGPSASSAPGQDRQRRVLGAGNAHLALERNAAGDLQLIHARPAPPGCQGFDRQRVDLAPDPLAQRAIDELVARDALQAGEGGG